MNTNPQLDPHPDAESLNAFAEQLLPDHERQPILAHLATCARCRQILFLAQDAAEQDATQQAQPATARPILLAAPKKQPPNWRLAWGALAACVALAASSVLLYPHHPANTPEEPHQQANNSIPSQAPASTPPAAAPPHTAAKPEDKKSPSPESSRHFHPAAGTVAAAAPRPGVTLDAVTLSPPAQQPPAQAQTATGASTTLNITLKPAAASQTVEVQSAPIQSAAPPRHSEAATVNVAADNAPLQPSTAPITQTMSAQTVQPTEQLPLQGRNFHALGAAKAAPKSAPQSGAVGYGVGGAMANGVGRSAIASAKSPASFANKAPLIVTPDDESAARNALQKTLPSGLPAISAVSAGHHLLALDSTGAVFLSEDSGAVWEPIPPSWTGRALTVSLSRPTAAPQPQGTANGLPSNAPVDSLQPIAAPSQFEIVTDTGVTWTSPDGRIWKTKGQKVESAR